MDPILEMLAEVDQSSSSIQTVPLRRKRKRKKEISHPGIPGADNRWYPSRGQAKNAALHMATQLGPEYRIKWNKAHGPGQQAHYHVVDPAGNQTSGHFFYGKKVVRRARRGRSDGEALFEVSRSSRTYIRWVQSSLNQIMQAGLIVDGISGSRTRSAIRNFQRRARIGVDGQVGPITERALISAGASRPPGSSTPSPSMPVPSGTSLRSNAARIAIAEWERWARGTKKESASSMRSTLRDYWQTGVGWLPQGSTWWSSTPWSAAFISWVMKKASAGNAFHYSARHTDYVGAAKRNRVAGNSNPFKAYRVTEFAPRVGDIVCRERSNSGVTYDNVDKGSYNSHCDIVVAIRDGEIFTIGGNVSNSVKRSTVRTNSSGRVSQSGYYAIIRVGS